MATLPKRLLESPAGFPDMGPAEAIVQARVLDIIRKHYERAGYAPLETPLVERSQILTAKAGGETQKQIYALRLLNPAEGGSDEKDLALRFDLTVPFARFAAANYGKGKILFPLRRYAIGPVVRGERPKKGRYRQFIQADIDVIGDGSLSIYHDSEMVGIVAGIFEELAVGPFTLRLNNRKVLVGFLRSLGCDSEDKVKEALASVDDMEKVGHDATVERLVRNGLDENGAREILQLLTEKRSTNEALAMIKSKQFDASYQEGVAELEALVRDVRQLGVSEDQFRVDPSLARGLDYYTGTVYEGYLHALPGLTVVAGGRFDNLAAHFIDKHLPGVGISIGVSRLVSLLIDAKLMSTNVSTVAPVLITTALDLAGHSGLYLDQARQLRSAGIATEIYLEQHQKNNLGKQMQFAHRRGFRIVLITGEDELKNRVVAVRDMKAGEQHVVSQEMLVETVKSML